MGNKTETLILIAGLILIFFKQVSPLLLTLISYVFWYFVRYITFIAIGYSALLYLIQPIFSRLFVRIRYSSKFN